LSGKKARTGAGKKLQKNQERRFLKIVTKHWAKAATTWKNKKWGVGEALTFGSGMKRDQLKCKGNQAKRKIERGSRGGGFTKNQRVRRRRLWGCAAKKIKKKLSGAWTRVRRPGGWGWDGTKKGSRPSGDPLEKREVSRKKKRS